MNHKIYVHHQQQQLLSHYAIFRVIQLDILPNGHLIHQSDLEEKGTAVNINMDDIMYLTPFNKFKHNNTLIRLKGLENHCYVIRDTLLNLEKLLNSNIYVRSHYSYIVNINFADWFLPPNRIFMGNYVLPVGKHYVENLKEKLFPRNN